MVYGEKSKYKHTIFIKPNYNDTHPELALYLSLRQRGESAYQNLDNQK